MLLIIVSFIGVFLILSGSYCALQGAGESARPDWFGDLRKDRVGILMMIMAIASALVVTWGFVKFAAP